VAISLDDGEVIKLVSGSDLYGYPTVNPDGSLLAWIQWSHPNMPWDSTELFLAAVQANGSLSAPQKIAGAGESITQPRWSPSGKLYYVSDRDNWWNIYNSDGEQLSLERAEFATPYWQFGMSCFDFIDSERMAGICSSNGRRIAGMLEEKSFSPLPSIYDNHYSACTHEGRLCTVASNKQCGPRIVAIEQNGDCEVLYNPSALALDEADISTPRTLYFDSGGAQVHAFYYPPCNGKFTKVEGEQPPLIAMCHGGPTDATDSSLSLQIQYWSSRGFAVVDINYRCSTGLGRE